MIMGIQNIIIIIAYELVKKELKILINYILNKERHLKKGGKLLNFKKGLRNFETSDFDYVKGH
jgi:hypothetical protein